MTIRHDSKWRNEPSAFTVVDWFPTGYVRTCQANTLFPRGTIGTAEVKSNQLVGAGSPQRTPPHTDRYYFLLLSPLAA